MSDINFQPVFDYIDLQTEQLRSEVASKKDIQQLKNSLDGLAKKFDTLDKETIVGKAKTERVEHWVMQAANNTELPYTI